MNVSVVIPAYNSAATIAETLRSLCDQTFKGWEAIIVDDGSTDDTLSIVQSFVESDSRFRCARQAHLGVSAARNIGIDHTNYNWLLFLDSDDWILPQHLERLTNVLATDPQVDAVHCGWSHIAPDGRPVDNKHWADSGDLFEAFAHTCAFTIHACVFRKSLAIAVGGFDLSYRTCEDWDFWLRIARTGARFRSLPEALSLYRMRPNSASVDGRQLLKDIIRVLEQACSPDPRVPQVYPAHANGDSRATLAERKFYSACWAAGLVLGHGESARDLLDLLKDEIAPKMDPRAVAEILFEAVPISRSEGIQDWASFGHLLMPLIDEFLVALEDRTLTFGLTPVALKALSDLALKHSTQPRPFKFGTTCVVRVDVNQPIPAQSFPASIERLRCEIEFEGERIGMVELPVCDGVVPSQVLADAIAADYSWPILGRFFQRTIYPNLVVDRSATGLSVRRGPLLLTDKLSEKVGDPWSALHDSIGWAVFLQEIWGRESWPHANFYDPNVKEEGSEPLSVRGDRLMLEVGQDIPEVEASSQELHVLLTVGGVALGVVTVPASQNPVRAQELRAAVTVATGFELCRAVVREALIGKPFAGKQSLRERLAEAASEAGTTASLLASPEDAINNWHLKAEHTLVLGRRPGTAFGTSASRRAMLPSAVAQDMVNAAAAAEEPLWQFDHRQVIDHVAYAPELVICPRSISRGVGRNEQLHGDEAAVAAHRAPWDRIETPGASGAIQVVRPLAPAPIPGGKVFVTSQLPILAYHRVAPDGSPALARYRIAPKEFEEQIRYLSEAGFYAVTLEQWQAASHRKQPLAGRAVILTFDDGYVDFMEYAWPVLRRYGFSATVFLVANYIGSTNGWDEIRGETIPLLGWDQICQLYKEGVAFGSHSSSHRHPVSLSVTEIAGEAARSRAILLRALGAPVTSFAYPYGEFDPVITHLVGACGYVYGLTTEPNFCRFDDGLLRLPRFEVYGSDTLQEFIKKVSPAPQMA